MNYFNQQCPVCKEIFKDGDDIVVCPECATPHHRHCWFSNGQCINSSLHGADFVWTAEKAKTPESETEAEVPSPAEAETESTDVKICPICSSENPADSTHCGNCGAFFGQKEERTKKCANCGAENHPDSMICSYCGTPYPYEGSNPFTDSLGIDENETIGNYSAADYAFYTQLNARRYIPKFRKIEEKKFSFNWAAFVFGPSWFLFRKIYKAGIILILIFVSITMMTTPLQNQVYDAAEKFRSASQPIAENSQAIENLSDEEYAQLMKNTEEFYVSVQKPMLILMGILFAQHLVCGLIADRMYYHKVKSDLALIDRTVENGEMRKMMVARRGGCSVLAYFAGHFGEQMLLSLFVTLADKISHLF